MHLISCEHTFQFSIENSYNHEKQRLTIKETLRIKLQLREENYPAVLIEWNETGKI